MTRPFSHYSDITNARHAPERYQHSADADPGLDASPLRLVEQLVSEAIPIATSASDLPWPDACIEATWDILGDCCPAARFTHYEQVWLTAWLDHAIGLDAYYLTEDDAVKYPETWADVTGHILEYALFDVVCDRLTGRLTYDPVDGLAVQHAKMPPQDAPTASEAALTTPPYSTTKTVALVQSLVGYVEQALQNDSAPNYEAAFQQAYNAHEDRLPDTVTGTAALLDGLHHEYDLTGTDCIESKQAEAAANEDWVAAIKALEYHALQHAVPVHIADHADRPLPFEYPLPGESSASPCAR